MAVFKVHASADGSMTKDAFTRACEGDLKLNMTTAELSRVFDWATSKSIGSSQMNGDTFVQCVRQRFFLRSVSTLSTIQSNFNIPNNFDYERDTASNYDGGPGTPFLGAYKDIRATRDHSYHGRYTEARQRWQDAALDSVVQRTEPQLQPWLVFTCGGMGVGKGYALGWLSQQGIFPLEDIVHIDPDHFKSVLPEWKSFVAHAQKKGDATLAGSRCHKESCYLQELALEEALRRRQNCWVDGSLRNAQWFIGVFADIRERFPDYRVAIIAVRASLDVVLQRVESRAKATGRSVPESLVRESLDAVDRSVSILGPQADFVAEVLNEGCVPTLAKVTTIDRSGAWAALKQRFARTLPAAHEFPTSLAPIAIVRLSPPDGHDALRLELLSSAEDGERGARKAILTSVATSSSASSAAPAPAAAAHDLLLDPECPLAALSDNQRTQAAVPADAATVARFRVVGSAHREVNGVSLTFGGFAYFDKQGGLLAVNALQPLKISRGVATPVEGDRAAPGGAAAQALDTWRHRRLIEFGPQEALSEAEATEIPISRWDAVLPAHRQYEAGARRVAWLMAYEKLRGRMIATGGGFVYELQAANGREYVLFPMLAD